MYGCVLRVLLIEVVCLYCDEVVWAAWLLGTGGGADDDNGMNVCKGRSIMASSW